MSLQTPGIQGKVHNLFRFHIVAFASLFSWALFCTLFFWSAGYEQRWTLDTAETFYRIVSQTIDDQSFQRGQGLWTTLWDGWLRVVLHSPVTAWYQGFFDAYLRAFLLAWGDISLAYKIQVFPLTLFFGTVAYFFFYRLTGNRWVALALAFAALLPMPLSWAGERSGFGPVWNYTRRYFLTACVPLIAWLYFRGARQANGWLLLAVAVAGLAANLHASGVILLEILVVAWMISEPLTVRRTMQAGGLMLLGLLFSVAAMGSLWARGLKKVSELMLAGISNEVLAATTIKLLEASKAAVVAPLQYLFYPPKIYEHLPGWLMDSWLLLTCMISLTPLLLRARYKRESAIFLFVGAAACLLFISFEQMWGWVLLASMLYWVGRKSPPSPYFFLSCYLLLSTFWVSVLGMLFFQLGYALIQGFPLIFDQLRGIRFMGFWVFAWIAALSVPAMDSLPSTSLRLKRGLFAALGIALLLLSQTVYRQYFREQDKDQVEMRRALLDIASWAKTHTAPDSIFLVGYASFGTLAERHIVSTERQMKANGIDWIPPASLKKPDESLFLAKGINITHMLIAPGDVVPILEKCILYRNSQFALAERDCVSDAIGSGAL